MHESHQFFILASTRSQTTRLLGPFSVFRFLCVLPNPRRFCRPTYNIMRDSKTRFTPKQGFTSGLEYLDAVELNYKRTKIDVNVCLVQYSTGDRGLELLFLRAVQTVKNHFSCFSSRGWSKINWITLYFSEYLENYQRCFAHQFHCMLNMSIVCQ